MKGIVFTNFLEMVEQQYGYTVADRLVSESDLESKGIYTAVGHYNYEEFHALLNKLATETGIDSYSLNVHFGEYYFDKLIGYYPFVTVRMKDIVEFLSGLDDFIHIDMKQRYPEEKFPYLETEKISEDQVRIIYDSERRMGGLAEGLLNGCLKHFNTEATVERTRVSDERVDFVVTRK